MVDSSNYTTVGKLNTNTEGRGHGEGQLDREDRKNIDIGRDLNLEEILEID